MPLNEAVEEGEEEFISLANLDDNQWKEESESEDEQDEQSQHKSPFNPNTITPETFHHLLSLYPITAENLYREKLLLKEYTKGKSAKETKRHVRRAIHEDYQNGNGKVDVNDKTNRQVERQIEAFREAEFIRYEGLPAEILDKREYYARKASGKAAEGNGDNGKDNENSNANDDANGNDGDKGESKLEKRKRKIQQQKQEMPEWLEKDDLITLIDWKVYVL